METCAHAAWAAAVKDIAGMVCVMFVAYGIYRLCVLAATLRE